MNQLSTLKGAAQAATRGAIASGRSYIARADQARTCAPFVVASNLTDEAREVIATVHVNPSERTQSISIRISDEFLAAHDGQVLAAAIAVAPAEPAIVGAF